LLRASISRYGVLITLLVLCLFIGIVNPVFFSFSNISNILVQATINGILAVGLTFVIITAGIDLSVGSILAFSGVVLGSFLQKGSPLPLAIFICLAIGILCGFTNGLLITAGRLPPFIATLGMMSISRGLALLYTGGRSISGFSPTFTAIADGRLFKIPVPVLIMFLVYALAFFVMKYTYLGKYIYAIGGNKEASWLSGIRVNLYITAVYSVSGLLSAIGGIILAARLNSAQPIAGMMYELDAIAAAVIGGTSLSGGKGSIIGTLIGTLILAVIKNGLNILNISSFIQQIIIGSVIVSAVILDKLKKES